MVELGEQYFVLLTRSSLMRGMVWLGHVALGLRMQGA